jgi:hypothetical protein
VEFTLDSKEIESSNGYVKLEWEAETNAIFELQQALSNTFSDTKRIYLGHDSASFISGLKDGTYYFRVRSNGGKWSEKLVVRVKHQSLSLAFLLFNIGAIVFILTAWVIIKESQKSASIQD